MQNIDTEKKKALGKNLMLLSFTLAIEFSILI